MALLRRIYMQKIIITGGAGFIGSHLAKRLVKDGHQVIILDNLLTGNINNVPEGAEFIHADINDFKRIEPLFEGVDTVFNMAAIARTPWTIDEPLLSHEVTATGALNVLEASKRHAVKRLVHSSSCILYVPNTPYYVAKLAAEEYTRIYHELYGLSTVALRYSNVYGPGQSELGPSPNVFASLRRDKKKHGTIFITGDGEQTRDYTHVNDIVEANILAAGSKESGAYYVGTGISTSLNEVAPYFECPVVYTEERLGDIKHLVRDGSEFREKFGWEPKVSINDGIYDVL